MPVTALAETIREIAGVAVPIEFIARPVDEPRDPPPRHQPGRARARLAAAGENPEGARAQIGWLAAQARRPAVLQPARKVA
jgi:hypothetical protein